MKKILITIVALGLLGLVCGCKPSHRVTFKPALVSVDPGEGWQQVEMPARQLVCTPSLIGKAGMINALLLETEDNDIKRAADRMQASFANSSKAVADSFKQEEFKTESGLPGIHLSYSARSGKSTGPNQRSHNFITHNRRGQCVSISYITSPESESAAVLEAIKKSLQVE